MRLLAKAVSANGPDTVMRLVVAATLAIHCEGMATRTNFIKKFRAEADVRTLTKPRRRALLYAAVPMCSH